MNINESAGNRLQKLKGSDYEIMDGEPDIRGWDLQDSTGKDIGTIDDLIFDVQSRKVRYMVVDLDKDYINNKSNDVLIPIGIAELKKSDDEVLLPGVTPEMLASLPAYNNNIDTNMETTIRNVLEGVGTAGVGTYLMNDTDKNTDDFYNHEHFNEDNLFKNRITNTDETTSIPVIEENINVGKRTIETGGKYIKSRIIEKPVEEIINLKEEHAYVERNTVDRSADESDFDAFKEGEIEIKEYAEVPVVAKQARVIEEINIQKNVEERNETIKDTVRKTEVDIEDLKKDSTSSLRGDKETVK